jgi:LCP family protein required for cell wall assembly
MSDDGEFTRGAARRSDRHRTKQPPAKMATSRRPPKSPRTQRPAAQRRWTTVDPGARRRRRLGRLVIFGLIVAVLALVGGGAAFAWYHRIDQQLHPVTGELANMQSALSVAPPPGKPFYMVIMGVDTRPTDLAPARSDTLIVAYVDAARKRITTLSIPRDTRVDIPGRGTAKINEAMQLGGPKLTIQTVKDLTGLPISHWAYIDFSGFKDIVDAVGGIELYVPYTINDIQAANNHPSAKLVKKGLRLLDGAHALTFVRARHQFADQDYTRMRDQQIFLKALAKKVLSVNVMSMPALANSMSQNVHTDLPMSQIVGLALNFRGMSDKTLQSITMPSSPQTIGGVSYVIADSAGLAADAAKMERGELFVPVASSAATKTTATSASLAPAPGTITVSVRNGAGVAGIAKRVATKLTGLGFLIKDVGNIGTAPFAASLVVYRSSADKAKADVVAKSLHIAVVEASSRYAFSGQVLVVIGKDHGTSL